MREKLRDPILQLVVGAVSVILTIVFFWFQQSRKELSYEIVSLTPLVSVQDEARSRLQISFDGKPVEDVTLVVLRLQNSGNMPITPDDYVRSISFNFGQDAAILSAEVTESVPSNIGVSIKISSDAVELSPVLMNGGDSLTLKVLLTRGNSIVSADARIVGIRSISFKQTQTMSLASIIFYIGISTFFLLSSFYNYRSSRDRLEELVKTKHPVVKLEKLFTFIQLAVTIMAIILLSYWIWKLILQLS